MNTLETFKEAHNKMREFLKKELVKYMDHIDNAEYDKANEIRQAILPYSHMFYVISTYHLGNLICYYPNEYSRNYEIIRLQKSITRLDIHMEDHWKSSLILFNQCATDYEKEYTLI